PSTAHVTTNEAPITIAFWPKRRRDISPEAGASRRSSRTSCLRDDGAGWTGMGNLGGARTEVASHRIGPRRENLSAPRPKEIRRRADHRAVSRFFLREY